MRKMSDNHTISGITTDGKAFQAVFDGGKPLEGCPASFEEFWEWTEKANENKNEFHEPNWGTDCGYKLDFDGPLLSVDSRFYPPKEGYGEGWDGNVSICYKETEITKKAFKAATLDELKEQVETYMTKTGEEVLRLVVNLFKSKEEYSGKGIHD